MTEPEKPGRLADQEQTRNRLEILNQFFRGMLALNGGGCIALLAFLQAIWKEASQGFVRGILLGMALFIAGLVFTVVGQYVRYETSMAVQFQRKHGRALQFVYQWLVILSVVAFVVGVAFVIFGAWNEGRYKV